MVLCRNFLVCGVALVFANQVECFQSALPRTSVVDTQPRNDIKSEGIVASNTRTKLSARNDWYDDDIDENQFRPDTSFGSEAVPEGQRPVNEYLEVTQAPLFGWASEEVGDEGLLKRLGIVYAVSFFFVCYPIAGATFTQDGYELQKIASANVGTILLVLAVLGRIYSGWSYLGDRLTSKVVEYEETGWYDGQVELKTKKEKMRDQLLYEQSVKPAVDRLKQFGLSAAGLCLVSVVGLNVALSINPLFDEYDPEMLNRLRYDDKLAEKAAMNSATKPAYCDSRYYRAVAGGGQGCN